MELKRIDKAELVQNTPLSRFEEQKKLHEENRKSFENADIINGWLANKSKRTQGMYLIDIKRFLDHFQHIHIGYISDQQLHEFVAMLHQTDLAINSVCRIISTIKSLFSYAHQINAIPFNTSASIKTPKAQESLTERILSHQEILKILVAAETKPRDYILIRLLYITGIRISEIVGLSWKDIVKREDNAQITVLGKGNKTRSVLIDLETYNFLMSLNGEKEAIFVSQKGNRMEQSTVWRMIKKYAKVSGITEKISPHWFRHAHASHSLEAGAPIHLVQNTLGHSNVSTTGRYLHARPSESSSKYIKL